MECLLGGRLVVWRERIEAKSEKARQRSERGEGLLVMHTIGY